MSDEFLDHYRECGRPQTHHVYAHKDDGAITDETFAQMESLSDFETGSFYLPPDPNRKLIKRWRR